MNIPSDKEIFRRIKENDEEIIHFLRTEYKPMIKHLVVDYRYSNGKKTIKGTQADVDDLIHDALYIVIKKIRNNDLVLTCKLSTYFYAVCRNLLKAKLYKRLLEDDYKIFNEEESYIHGDTDSLYDKHLIKKVYDHYYEKLCKSCKRILSLYWLEFTVTEISEKLGFTKNYIMKRKYECKNMLVDMIKENPDNI